MAVTAFWYGKALANLLGGETAGESSAVDWLSDTIRVMLTTSAYTPAQDTDEFKSSVTNEVSGAGYTARGEALANKTLTYTAGTNVNALDADDVSWAAATFTARYAVVYKDTGVDATSVLLGYVDFGGDQTVSAATFTITWAAGGIFTLTAA